MMDEQGDPSSRSKSKHLPGNIASHCNTLQTTPDREWLQQVYQMYHLMQNVDRFYPLQLQGSHPPSLGGVNSFRVNPPEVVGALPFQENLQDTSSHCVFPAWLVRQPPGNLTGTVASPSEVGQQSPPISPPDTTCTSFILSSPGPQKSTPPLPSQGKNPSTAAMNMIKQESPTLHHCSFTDAAKRKHMLELQGTHSNSTTRDTLLPQLSTTYNIPTASKSYQGLKCSFIEKHSSKDSSATQNKQTLESQNRSLTSSSFYEASERHASELRHCFEHAGKDGGKNSVPIELGKVSMKNVSSTTPTVVKVHSRLLSKKDHNESLLMNQDDLQQIHHNCSPVRKEPFIPPSESQKVNKNFSRESSLRTKLNADAQNATPGFLSIHSEQRQGVTISKVDISDKLSTSKAEGTRGKAVTEFLPITVSEVGCSNQKMLPEYVPVLEEAPSTSIEMLHSKLRDKSTKTKEMLSSFKASSLGQCHPSTTLPQSNIVRDSCSPKKTSGNKPFLSPESTYASTCHDRQSPVQELMTSTDEKTDYKVQPPSDNKCPVCGDTVSGYHYGLYSCESCKGFFKRTIHSKRHERLNCSFGGRCTVTLQSRKQCASCRFQKCISLGMKLEAIRQDRQRGGRSLYQGSSEQRRLMKLRDEQQTSASSAHKKRKRKQSTIVQPDDHPVTKAVGSPQLAATPLPSPMPSQTGPQQDQGLPQLIQDLVMQEEAFIKRSEVTQCCIDTLRQETNLLETLCHFANHQVLPLFRWAEGLPLYRELIMDDQIHLFNSSILSIQCLNLVFYCLDRAGRLLLPQNQVIDLTTFTANKFNKLVPKITSIGHQLHAAGLDLPRFVCLKLFLLLNSDTPMLKNSEEVHRYQETVQDLFFSYVAENQPQDSRVTGKIMLALAAIERIAQQIGKETLCDMEIIGFMFRNREKTDLVHSDRPWIRTGLCE